jgi:recombination protein RecA
MSQLLEKIIMRFNKNTNKIEKLTTGLLAVDYVTDGGIPRGEVVEIYGENGVGKTTLSLIIAKTFLEKVPDKAVVYIDTEYSLDSEWCKKNGLDLEKYMEEKKFFVLNPDTLDDALNLALDAVKTNEVSLVVIDSIAALAPAEMFDTDDPIAYNKPGTTAKKQTNFFGVVGKLLYETKTTLLVINQMRANISPYGAATITPGSYAFKHKTALRIEAKRDDYINGRAEPTGILVKLKVVKNKHGIPYRVGNVAITFKNGMDIVESNIDMMINFGILKRSGAYYTVGEDKVQGRKNLYDYFIQHPDVYERYVKETLEYIEKLKDMD